MDIISLNFKDRSLLFANLARIAYYNIDKAKSQAKKLGFSTIEFYDREGAQAYRFMNKTDLVIACRGTEPTQWNDISADLKAIPVMSETISRVHKGFKEEVDELWPMVCEDINRKTNLKKNLWFCGHSLGGAMATIMASRAKFNDELNDPVELYTYGSPRVGWKKYVNSLEVTHHRWKNNNDIVTKVPLWIMGYRHHGTMHYITSDNKIGKPGFKDWCKGMWAGIKARKFDSIGDHDIVAYHKNISEAL